MVYAPGTLETDPKKQNMALQQQASAIKTVTTDTATNTAGIATNTANIATNASAIAALQSGPLTSGNVATKSDQTTATSTSLAVTPGRQQFHPSAVKAWAYVTYSGTTPTLQAGYNITSASRSALGQTTFTLTVGMTSSNYAVVVSAQNSGTNSSFGNVPTIVSSTSFTIFHFEANTAADPATLHVMVLGTQ